MATVNEVNAQRSRYPVLIDLTQLTGKLSQTERSMAWNGFEFNRRYVIIALGALPIAFIALLSFWPLLHEFALILFAAIEILAFWLFEARSRKGLQLRNYQTIFDNQRSVENVFILCGQQLRPENMSPGWIYCSSEPAHPEDFADRDADRHDTAADAAALADSVFAEATGDAPAGASSGRAAAHEPIIARASKPAASAPTSVSLDDLLR